MRRREYGIVSGLMLTAVVLLSGCALSDTRAETTQQTDSPVIQAGQGEQENANGPGTVQRAASSEGKEEAATEEGSSAEVTQAAQVSSGTGAKVADAPRVYMTADISPAGLRKVYEALGRTPQGRVAVKLSTGEAGNTHYLSPDLIKDLVQSVDGTIVECNTAYGGSRASTAMHRQVRSWSTWARRTWCSSV